MMSDANKPHSGRELHCPSPYCSFTADSAAEIEDHVNAKHPRQYNGLA